MRTVDPVRSSKNARLRVIRALRAGRDPEHLLLEGAHLLAEALQAGAALDWVLYEEDGVGPEQARLLEAAAGAGVETVACEARLLRAASELATAPGLLAYGPRPRSSARAVFEAAAGGLVLVSAGVQEPGNVGALVRVAAGLGADGLIALKGGASPWHPRALRGASGTTFRLPVADRVTPEELTDAARDFEVPLWEACAGGGSVDGCRPERGVALVLGEEGGGVPAAVARACEARVGIPLARGVESLNVATAAAVLVYALRKER